MQCKCPQCVQYNSLENTRKDFEIFFCVNVTSSRARAEIKQSKRAIKISTLLSVECGHSTTVDSAAT